MPTYQFIVGVWLVGQDQGRYWGPAGVDGEAEGGAGLAGDCGEWLPALIIITHLQALDKSNDGLINQEAFVNFCIHDCDY